jgi:hypothetical protein
VGREWRRPEGGRPGDKSPDALTWPTLDMNNSYLVSKDALVVRFSWILGMLWTFAAPIAMQPQTVPAEPSLWRRFTARR